MNSNYVKKHAALFFVAATAIVMFSQISFANEENYQNNIESNQDIEALMAKSFYGTTEKGEACEVKIQQQDIQESIGARGFVHSYFNYNVSLLVHGENGGFPINLSTQNGENITGVDFEVTRHQIKIEMCDRLPCIFGGKIQMKVDYSGAEIKRATYSSSSDYGANNGCGPRFLGGQFPCKQHNEPSVTVCEINQ